MTRVLPAAWSADAPGGNEIGRLCAALLDDAHAFVAGRERELRLDRPVTVRGGRRPHQRAGFY
jgi:hypothetical protein